MDSKRHSFTIPAKGNILFGYMYDNIEYNSELKEGVDYHLTKEGYRIMTESFLKNRGYCCGNGCKNCPYYPKARKGNTNLR